MKTFFGDYNLKKEYLERVQKHRALGHFMGEVYIKRDKDGNIIAGSAAVCILHSRNYAESETQLGIPSELMHLADVIFEGLAWFEDDSYMSVAEDFLNAIPVGADLSMVMPQFLMWLFSPDGIILQNVDPEKDEVLSVVNSTHYLFKKWVETGKRPDFEEWDAVARLAREIKPKLKSERIAVCVALEAAKAGKRDLERAKLAEVALAESAMGVVEIKSWESSWKLGTEAIIADRKDKAVKACKLMKDKLTELIKNVPPQEDNDMFLEEISKASDVYSDYWEWLRRGNFSDARSMILALTNIEQNPFITAKRRAEWALWYLVVICKCNPDKIAKLAYQFAALTYPILNKKMREIVNLLSEFHEFDFDVDLRAFIRIAELEAEKTKLKAKHRPDHAFAIRAVAFASRAALEKFLHENPAKSQQVILRNVWDFAVFALQSMYVAMEKKRNAALMKICRETLLEAVEKVNE